MEDRMEDRKIIQLFFSRSQEAIWELSRKYGKFCYRIALNILKNHEDAEEIGARFHTMIEPFAVLLPEETGAGG